MSVAHDRFLRRWRCGVAAGCRRRTQSAADRAISPSLQQSPAPGPNVTGSSSQAASSAARSLRSGSGTAAGRRRPRAFGLAAAQRDQRAEHGLVGRVALLQALRERRQDMRRLAKSVAGFVAGSVERYSRNSGRKSGSSLAVMRARLLVERLEIDHRLAAVAALAVHVLEQMQRQRARPVEQQRHSAPADRRDRRWRVRRTDALERRAYPGGDQAVPRRSPRSISPSACCSSAVG